MIEYEKGQSMRIALFSLLLDVFSHLFHLPREFRQRFIFPAELHHQEVTEEVGDDGGQKTDYG